AFVDARRVLQRLQTVEEQQGALALDKLGERTGALDRIAWKFAIEAEFDERPRNERVGVGPLLLARTLRVSRPTIDAYGAAAALGQKIIGKSSDQCRFAGSAESVKNDGVDFLRREACPRIAQYRELGRAADQSVRRTWDIAEFRRRSQGRSH